VFFQNHSNICVVLRHSSLKFIVSRHGYGKMYSGSHPCGLRFDRVLSEVGQLPYGVFRKPPVPTNTRASYDCSPFATTHRGVAVRGAQGPAAGVLRAPSTRRSS
jgi:hypothetical protein